MTTPVRAALYLRVSTGRQADNDLSIPDQRREAKAYCASRGWEIVADYVEPGLSATDDRRPEFQRMIDAATTKPPAFDVILVHSFSRFFPQLVPARVLRPPPRQGRGPAGVDHTGARRRSHEQHDPADHGAVRRVPVQGERQAHAAGHERECPSGLLGMARYRRSAIGS